MTKRKWGESFLKSGMPLEHLTYVILRSLEYECHSNIEYNRFNESGQKVWFEIDLHAISPDLNKETYLSFLIECKYHDLNRFWFFFPHDAAAWHFNDRFFNCGPFQTLSHPTKRTTLSLAPLSYKGIVISEDGQKQDNAVYNATQQLANAFVPISLFYMFDFLLHADSPANVSMVPMVITNSKLFRLKPNIYNLQLIREASKPEDIADEVGWTICYFQPANDLYERNAHYIEDHIKEKKESLDKVPITYSRLELWAGRPNWIIITNIDYLMEAVNVVSKHFMALSMCNISTSLRGNRKVRVR